MNRYCIIFVCLCSMLLVGQGCPGIGGSSSTTDTSNSNQSSNTGQTDTSTPTDTTGERVFLSSQPGTASDQIVCYDGWLGVYKNDHLISGIPLYGRVPANYCSAFGSVSISGVKSGDVIRIELQGASDTLAQCYYLGALYLVTMHDVNGGPVTSATTQYSIYKQTKLADTAYPLECSVTHAQGQVLYTTSYTY